MPAFRKIVIFYNFSEEKLLLDTIKQKEDPMLRRKITSRLQKWKNSKSQKVLCITGARKTGKSSVVRAFAKENYEVFVELNFRDDVRARKIFEEGLGLEQWLSGIGALSGRQLVPGQTLVLLDEIQQCPEARTAVKDLIEDGRYDCIETLSLPGRQDSDLHSSLTDYEEPVRMYPLDLEEFFWAMSVQPEVFAHLQSCYENHQPVNQAVHARLLDLFRYYLVVGGMPEVVQSFVKERGFPSMAYLQKQIVDGYRLDIFRYASPANQVKIGNLFESVLCSSLTNRLAFI